MQPIYLSLCADIGCLLQLIKPGLYSAHNCYACYVTVPYLEISCGNRPEDYNNQIFSP